MLELKFLCSSLEVEVLRLAKAYQREKKENATLKTRNKELREEVVKLKEEKKMQSDQIVKQKLSERAAAGNNTDVKRKINELVREIDRCIGLLND